MPTSPHAQAAIAAFTLEHDPPWLVARFPVAQRMLSWAINRPGWQECDRVAWLQVTNADLPRGTDPADYLQRRLDACGLGDAVGLMTSSPVERFCTAEASVDRVHAACLTTLGLSNAERVGVRRTDRVAPPARPAAVGTINTLCSVSVPLSEPAMLEALSLVTQARTTAILEQGYEPVPGAGAVTGTGTDCIVIACPVGGAGLPFAGMHTPLGEAVGASVLTATRAAMEDWIQRRVVSPSPRIR